MTNPLKSLFGAGRRAFGRGGNGGFGSPGIGYDAVRPRGKRATPGARVLSEDQELAQLPRRQLSTGIRDLNRNFSIAAWMIRRHLDYVSTFHFRSKTGIKELDAQIESFVRWWSLPQNCDPAGRHSLQRLIRMWEMRRVIDGDVLINRLKYGHVQTIEGDRIQTLGAIPYDEIGIGDLRYVVNGVWINDWGKAKGYMVFKRPPQWTGLQWDRMVPAQFADLFGYFDRYDQVRGISPLAASANSLRDTYESFDFALLKAKATQFLGFAVTRQASDSLDDIAGGGPDAEGGERPEEDGGPKYDVKFDRGPVMLDMDPGDKIEIIESAQPSDQFQNFSKVMIMVSLKALDIPFSFFDEAHTNYSGARMAGTQFYDAAVKIKQLDLRNLLDKLTRWRLAMAVVDGQVVLPDGFDFSMLRWDWSHSANPLYDPLKETSASIAAINAGLSSHEREAKKLGLDVYELIDEIARTQKYAKDAGVNLSTALPSTTNDDPNKEATKTEDQNEQEDDEAVKKPVGRNNIWGG